MKSYLVITILVITMAAVCKADNQVCAERGFNAVDFNDIDRAVNKLVKTIDREVGSRCVADRKFIERSGKVWVDVEAMGACKTLNDLKHTLFNVRNFIKDHRNDCRNFRIVSHGGTVASRIRL
jgi:hypothetical protein